jgi:hypothetical protein
MAIELATETESASQAGTGTLYRRVLGPDFDLLAPPLKQFHNQRAGGRASGLLAVERGRNWLARLIATLGGVPQQAAAVSVTLAVTEQRGVERWNRSFGTRRMITWQWQRGPLLIESSGPVAVGFRLSVQEGGLHFTPQRVWWCGLPVPRWFGPLVSASAVPDGKGWIVDVRLAGPLVGLIVRYHGKVMSE